MFEITLFGSTSVRCPDGLLGYADLPGAKPRQVLEIICLARGSGVSKADLAEHLWAGHPPQHGIATLETYVAVLRRALQPGVAGRNTIVRTVAGGYRLDADRVRLDLDDFDAAGASADRALTPAAAAASWQRAAELGARDLLEHEPHAEWAQAARADYARRAVHAAVRGAAAALDADQPELAVLLAERAVARDPLAEDGWQVLIAAHGTAGRPTAAARAFTACSDALERDLGVSPSPLTRGLLRSAIAETFSPLQQTVRSTS